MCGTCHFGDPYLYDSVFSLPTKTHELSRVKIVLDMVMTKSVTNTEFQNSDCDNAKQGLCPKDLPDIIAL